MTKNKKKKRGGGSRKNENAGKANLWGTDRYNSKKGGGRGKQRRREENHRVRLFHSFVVL